MALGTDGEKRRLKNEHQTLPRVRQVGTGTLS